MAPRKVSLRGAAQVGPAPNGGRRAIGTVAAAIAEFKSSFGMVRESRIEIATTKAYAVVASKSPKPQSGWLLFHAKRGGQYGPKHCTATQDHAGVGDGTF